MSNCATISLRRTSGISTSFTRVATGISTVASRVGGLSVSAERIGGIDAGFTRVGGNLVCRMGIVCGTNYGPHDNDILWAQDGKVLNVYGNKIYVTVI